MLLESLENLLGCKNSRNTQSLSLFWDRKDSDHHEVMLLNAQDFQQILTL